MRAFEEAGHRSAASVPWNEVGRDGPGVLQTPGQVLRLEPPVFPSLFVHPARQDDGQVLVGTERVDQNAGEDGDGDQSAPGASGQLQQGVRDGAHDSRAIHDATGTGMRESQHQVHDQSNDQGWPCGEDHVLDVIKKFSP